MHRRLEVDAQRALQALAGVVGQAPRSRQAGVGDEDVDRAGFGGQLLRRAGLGEIGGDGAVALARQLLGKLFERLRACGR